MERGAQTDQTITVNNDDPAKPENWFTAVWNYNLGFNKKADASTNGNWGLGWYNNPANPAFPASRHPFMNTDVDSLANKDAAHPQYWPYEEKVMGWAAWSIDTGFSYGTSGKQDWPGESGYATAGFRPAYWNGADLPYYIEGNARYNRAHVSPPLDTFCNSKNNCDTANPPHCPDAACYAQYWWHESSATWKPDCTTTCGFENIKSQTLINEPGRGYRLQHGTPECSGAPAGAKVVESVPAGTNTWSDCGTTTTDGSFQFTFYADPYATGPGLGQYDAKADLHQIVGGYQGHFWYTHARDADHLGGDGGRMTILGDWKLNSAVSGSQAKVYVHIPDTGAQVSNASYKIITPFGAVTKTVDQGANESGKWVSLGAYNFKDQAPEVQLTNSTPDGAADKDVAYDAVAFVPGDYSGIPSDLTFHDPDLNAVQPADVTTPTDVGMSVINGSGPAGPSATSAASVKAITVERPNGFVPWCNDEPFNLKQQWVNRSEACLKDHINVIIVDKDQAIVGTMEFDLQAEIKAYYNSATSNAMLKLVPTAATGLGATAPVTITSAGNCSVDCTTTKQIWNTSPTWDWAAGDRHVGEIQMGVVWGQSRSADFVGMGWDLGALVADVPSDNAVAISTDGYSELRCDTRVRTTPGRIFDHYKPTYVMNSQKFPAAAAHAWLIQHMLPGHLGLKGQGEPLTYLGDDVMSPAYPTKSQNSVNRDIVMCPSSWERNQSVTLSPELSSSGNDTPSCDEFAFAATYQSAGTPSSLGGTNPVASSDECVQTYAKRDDDGLWRLHADLRYTLPTWKEVCGRASMSNNQNTQSMALFPDFRNKNRLMDKDDYWLDVAKPH
ncbi:hypothetical protein [Streptomyces bungoensis]|uniref:golvesin C-terminal-like domain-containing protein n=1 Tax=Streptomyces bungoensis TaxID=285568 RepID=UPI00343CCCE4